MSVAITYKADIKKAKGEPILAAIYARYSSHSQTEQSIEGQLSSGRAYAAGHGYTVVREYCDRATSGRTDNREQFQRMMSDLEKHLFDVIITWKIDRIGRNREDIAFHKHRMKKAGIRIEYVAENLPDSAESIILESVLEGMAEYYSVQLSANVRRGMLESAKKLQYFGGSVPLGYKINPETKTYEIDESGAEIVRRIFEMYAAGSSETEILTWLNAQGARTSRGNAWGKSSLTKLLHNEKYIGVYAYTDAVRVEDGIPAIIDPDTFHKVQEQMKINKRAPSHRWTRINYVLTGKLFCGECGAPMVGLSGFSATGSKYGYYICTKRRREKACPKKPVRQDWIEGIVVKATRDLLADDELLEQITDATHAYYLETHKPDEQIKRLQDGLRNVIKGIKNLLDLLEKGNTNPSLIDRLTALESQKTGIETQIAEAQAKAGLRITREQIEYFLRQYRDANLEDVQCQHRLIQTFVQSIRVYDDRVTLIYNVIKDELTVPETGNDEFVRALNGGPKWSTYELRITGTAVMLTVPI